MGIVHQWLEATLYSRLTLFAIAVTMAFHLAAMLCKSWMQVTLGDGRFVSVGLFQSIPDEVQSELSYEHIYIIQRDVSLYIVTRLLVVMTMVLLYCGMATVIAYCFVNRVKYYRLRLTSANVAVCAIAGVLMFVALVMYVAEVQKLPVKLKPRVSWSFGLGVISSFCSFVTFAFLVLDYKIVSSRTYTVDLTGFTTFRTFRERF